MYSCNPPQICLDNMRMSDERTPLQDPAGRARFRSETHQARENNRILSELGGVPIGTSLPACASRLSDQHAVGHVPGSTQTALAASQVLQTSNVYPEQQMLHGQSENPPTSLIRQSMSYRIILCPLKICTRENMSFRHW